jgi:hypothetical protein
MSTREDEGSVRATVDTLSEQERAAKPNHADETGTGQNKTEPKPSGQMGELE